MEAAREVGREGERREAAAAEKGEGAASEEAAAAEDAPPESIVAVVVLVLESHMSSHSVVGRWRELGVSSLVVKKGKCGGCLVGGCVGRSCSQWSSIGRKIFVSIFIRRANLCGDELGKSVCSRGGVGTL